MASTLSVQVIEETCCLVASALGYPLLKDEQNTVLANFILGICNVILPTGFGKRWKESVLRLFATCVRQFA